VEITPLSFASTASCWSRRHDSAFPLRGDGHTSCSFRAARRWPSVAQSTCRRSLLHRDCRASIVCTSNENPVLAWCRRIISHERGLPVTSHRARGRAWMSCRQQGGRLFLSPKIRSERDPPTYLCMIQISVRGGIFKNGTVSRVLKLQKGFSREFWVPETVLGMVSGFMYSPYSEWTRIFYAPGSWFNTARTAFFFL